MHVRLMGPKRAKRATVRHRSGGGGRGRPPGAVSALHGGALLLNCAQTSFISRVSMVTVTCRLLLRSNTCSFLEILFIFVTLVSERAEASFLVSTQWILYIF